MTALSNKLPLLPSGPGGFVSRKSIFSGQPRLFYPLKVRRQPEKAHARLLLAPEDVIDGSGNFKGGDLCHAAKVQRALAQEAWTAWDMVTDYLVPLAERAGP